jgi:hypothetical protein
MEQGNPEAARQSWDRAISTGITPFAQEAEQLIGHMERRQDEQRRAEQFTRYGWQVYADEKMMTLRSPDGGEQQEKGNGSQVE